MKPLQIEGARALADAGAINHVRAVATGVGLFVEINRTFTVANRLKQTRYFAKADTCFSWLREMGISRIHEVDLTCWGAGEKPPIPGLSGILAFWKLSVSAVIGSEWIRLVNKAESLSNKGRHAEAIIAAMQALKQAEDSLEPDHPDIAVLLNCLANQHFALEQYELAEPLYKRALAIAEKQLGPDDPFVGMCLNNLAEAYDAQEKSEQTEPMYLRALTICEKDTDPDKSVEAIILTNLASLYAKKDSYEQAEQLCEKALEIWDDMSGLLSSKHPDTAFTLEVLADLYRQTGREEDAARLDKRADKISGRRS